jgi:hypothetical protein
MGDRAGLLKVKEQLVAVVKTGASLEERLATTKATLEYLQSLSAEGAPKQLTDLAASGYGGSAKELAALSSANDLWGTVKKSAPAKAAEIKPVEKGETNKLASEIQTYNKGVASYHKQFKQKPAFWDWETDVCI